MPGGQEYWVGLGAASQDCNEVQSRRQDSLLSMRAMHRDLPRHRSPRNGRHAGNPLVVPLRLGQGDHDRQTHNDRAGQGDGLSDKFDGGQLDVSDSVERHSASKLARSEGFDVSRTSTNPFDLLVIRSVTTLASRTEPRPSLSSKNMPTSLLVSLAASCETNTDRASDAASSMRAETSSLGGSGRRGGGTSYIGDRRRGGGDRRIGL